MTKFPLLFLSKYKADNYYRDTKPEEGTVVRSLKKELPVRIERGWTVAYVGECPTQQLLPDGSSKVTAVPGTVAIIGVPDLECRHPTRVYLVTA